MLTRQLHPEVYESVLYPRVYKSLLRYVKIDMTGIDGKVSLSQMHVLYFWVALVSREGIIYLLTCIDMYLVN